MKLFSMREDWTEIDGARIYARVSVDDQAHKPSLVLLPGVGLSGRYFLPLAHHLHRDYDVYAPDPVGFGRSSKRHEAPTVAMQTADLQSWLDVQGLHRVSLLGHSLGSQVAVDFAFRHPERVEKLVLVGPTPDPDARTLARMYGRQLINMPMEPLPLQVLYGIDSLQTGFVRMLQTIARTCDDSIETKLPAVRADTLVMRGRFDVVAPQAWAEKIADLLPRGHLVVIEGAAHCAHFSRAAKVAEQVSAFLPRRGARSEIGPWPALVH